MKTMRMNLPEGWYPKDEKSCAADIERYLSLVDHEMPTGEWIGGIVPHAGWYYSGKLACQVIHLLSQTKDVDVVAVMGGHLRPGDDIQYYDYEAFETPFGNIERCEELFEAVNEALGDSAMPDESVDNTVEIQLPFVRQFFPEAKILAFRSPPSHLAVKLGECLAREAQKLKKKIVFVGSTDLTHYGPNYGFQPKGVGEESVKWVKEHNDREFIKLLETMEGEKAIEHSLKHHSACSAGGAVACLAGCESLGKVEGAVLDYYTSYDVRKDLSFVGYVGVMY
ncbi:MAG: AmmeMemoRadiSam system protein B [Spirochaetota bacterium]|nr:AmmeMemoRadiSam system protein B [Spirochaetota bacterium]